MMKNKNVRNFSIGFVLCFLLAATAFAQSATVSVSPASTSKGIGQTFTVSVTATQLNDVLAYSFNIAYDSSKLAVTSITVGNYLSACSADPTTFKINNTGSVGLDAACLGSTVSSGTSMGSITFRTLAAGSSTLNLNSVSIDVGIPSSKANVTENDGSVTITGGTTTTVATTTTTTTTLPGTAVVSVADAKVKIGSTFDVPVTATQLSDVLAYTFRVAYDSSKLQAVSVTAGNYLSGCSTPTSFNTSTAGLIGLDVACLGQTVSSGTSLATIRFKALAVVSSTSLTLQGVEITRGSGSNTSTAPIIIDNGVVSIAKKSSSKDDFVVTLPSAAYANAAVSISITDSDTKDAVEKAQIDVYLGTDTNGKKVAYGTTDKNGSFTFVPAQTGKYTIVVAKSGYRDLEQTLSVSAGVTTTVVTTTSMKATTTIIKATTTTEPQQTTTTRRVTTTTVQPTTTTQAPVSTTRPVVTTTTQPKAGGIDMSTMLIGAVIVIIILALAYFAMKGKGKGAAAGKTSEKPKNGKTESK